MSTTDARLGSADQRIEVVVVPVSDVERAKEFYGRLGWRSDAVPAWAPPGGVQLTPPGSACSVQFGEHLTPAPPGSATAILVVSDIEAARDALLAAGVEVDEIFHIGPQGRIPGLDPGRGSCSPRRCATPCRWGRSSTRRARIGRWRWPRGSPGDAYVVHPFAVHAAQEHLGTEPRFMAQAPVMLTTPLAPGNGATALARAIDW
ncbi:VOC family protein [Nonomuraea composti]|uniref:VOC family protein n=1 Tax=Nonomuraea composti TaxID=2720023 RepID=UPI001F0F3DE2|nr:VOC family protein [Nonomuraea sp. FMUSA5-5]